MLFWFDIIMRHGAHLFLFDPFHPHLGVSRFIGAIKVPDYRIFPLADEKFIEWSGRALVTRYSRYLSSLKCTRSIMQWDNTTTCSNVPVGGMTTDDLPEWAIKVVVPRSTEQMLRFGYPPEVVDGIESHMTELLGRHDVCALGYDDIDRVTSDIGDRAIRYSSVG